MQQRWLGLTIGVVLASTWGCAAPVQPRLSPPQSSPLIGTWTTSRSTADTVELVFGTDSRFLIVESEMTLAEGQYVTTGNQLILQNEGDTASGDCTLAATYRFSIDGDSVSFERLHDDICTDRVTLLNKTWSRE